MHSLNSQIAHARRRVGNAEDAICRAEIAITRRLLWKMETAYDENRVQELHAKLGVARTELEALEAGDSEAQTA